MPANPVFSSFSWAHWFGTDSLGRDLGIRCLQGAGLSVLIVLGAILCSLLLATLFLFLRIQLRRFDHSLWGVLANSLDAILESVNAVPHFLMMMILGYGFFHTHEASNLAEQITLVFLTLAATYFPQLYLWLRFQETQFLSESFIISSRALGASPWQIYRKHFFSWIKSSLSRKLYFFAGSLLVAEGGLSFLGLSLQSPYPTLGALLREGWRAALYHPHLLLGPALTLLVLVSFFRFSEASTR